MRPYPQEHKDLRERLAEVEDLMAHHAWPHVHGVAAALEIDAIMFHDGIEEQQYYAEYDDYLTEMLCYGEPW